MYGSKYSSRRPNGIDRNIAIQALLNAALAEQQANKPWLEKPRRQRMYSMKYLMYRQAWLDGEASRIIERNYTDEGVA